jgi:hypothetical protein
MPPRGRGEVLAGYLVFSLVVLGLLVLLHLADIVVAGYLVIAVIGLVMVVRDMRAQARAEFAKEIGAAGDRLIARAATSQEAARNLPWYDEVTAAQKAAVMRGASIVGLFTSFNPYWSLSLDSLVRYGLTTQEQIATVTAMVRDEPPDRWRNGLMMSDLIASGLQRDEALVRIGLYMTNEDRFSDPRGR